MIPVIAVVGYSNSGKTMVVERLVRTLKQRGYRLATIKHAAHGYDIDVPGKDSRRCYDAGADKVMVVGPTSFTIHQHCARELRMREVCEQVTDVDLIIVEGYKTEPGPKIEVLRQGYFTRRLPLGQDLVAVVSDVPLLDRVPCFSFDQTEALAEAVVSLFKRQGFLGSRQEEA